MRHLLLCLVLLGCSNTDANHVGNPLLLPIGAVTTGIENATYNTRRNRVKAYVVANHDQLKQDAIAGQGPALTEVMKLAKVPTAKQSALLAELRRGIVQYFSNDAEPVVVAIMVHS